MAAHDMSLAMVPCTNCRHTYPDTALFCPNCGRPMEARRHVDNPTGRITWTIGCLNPKHFHTRGYMNAAIAEIQLEKLLHH